ncbi:putative hydroxylase [Sphaerisporangium krabiense]|uniref:3-hydroxy-9,10-secoandrosta-1,3,5(10)-triene-9, 17-dione monooxygenase n=1 Tax=Sphaerisporangium krabiense TaxID=763782 RepID=A0A7W8ZA58_9ACTN|nr:acyl-CoA dehydrogenase family protein [Sphaerisporangium krabiense]MBB5630244.1 3-hydroxy-9,10-secoandrosta-1,3,5(10)-triene-9,17-dione monooxygenase [Sphaerisporangium krabiense]GII62804.1 putative hydroxylase [Sphaerisporangium krabiense]
MTVITNVRERAVAAPPEPGLTPEEIIARAEAIAPTLVARQAETEARTYYAQDTHELFAEAGLYRILVPKRYGGYEFGVDTFFRVVMTLARGCPSTGWMYCLGAAHALAVATLFGERAQDEIFDGDFICPATIMPSGTAERTEDGDWIINGTWAYCSGSPYATHFVGHTLVAPEEGAEPVPMLFIVPSSQFRRLDDWGGQLGLKGSGSHSIKIENARIPDHFTIKSHISQFDVSGGTPGLTLHGNPQYGGGPLSIMILESAVLAAGIAHGALDAYEDLMRARTTSFPPITGRTENPDFQFWYGQAAGMLATAEAAVLNALQQWKDACARGPEAFTPELELRIAGIGREVVRLSWDAVQRYLFPTAGSSSVRVGERVERVWRDLSTMHSHAGVAIYLNGLAPREYAMARFGIEAHH